MASACGTITTMLVKSYIRYTYETTHENFGEIICPLMMNGRQVDPMHEIFPKMTKCDFFTHSSIGQVDVSEMDFKRNQDDNMFTSEI